jgi:DivIVA domain
MITPLEIENKEFSKQIRGYNADEVDEFLDLIIEDIETLQEELIALRNENADLREQNEDYKRSQVNVMNTIDTAKKLMKDISESAEKRAEIIIKNAKLDAEMIVRDAKDSASHYGNESAQLRDKILQFRARYKKLLRDEIDHIEDKGSDLLSDLEKELFVSPVDKTKRPNSVLRTEELSKEDAGSDILKELERDVGEAEDKLDSLDETKVIETIPEHMETKIGVPKETVALNSKDIEELIQKAENKAKGNVEDLDEI